jgi:hypothetical protein
VKADLGIHAGDLVRHNSYKDLLGIVVEVNLNYAGTPVAVAWTGRNPYGFGKTCCTGNKMSHWRDKLEVLS